MKLTEIDLISIFSSLTNWQDRYRQIIQLSKMLPDYPEKYRDESHQIIGCENRVWLTYKLSDNKKYIFYADSEGRIVKGLLAIILILVNHKTAKQIIEIDLFELLKELNVISELSESRQLGITKIIHQISKIVQLDV